jgi:hypothetical protein
MSFFSIYKIREQEDRIGLASGGGGVVPVEEQRWGKGLGG